MIHLARRLMLVSALLWASVLLFAPASIAWAEIEGNCEATLAGVDVRDRSSSNAGDAIDVENDEAVSVVFTSPAGFASHKIQLEFAGVKTTVSNQVDDGSTVFTDTVNVDDYATWGVGLYKVIGEATLNDGSTCSGAVLVNVNGNPLATVAGGVAAGITVIGFMGFAASSVSTAAQGNKTAGKIEDWILGELEAPGQSVGSDAPAAGQAGAGGQAHPPDPWLEFVSELDDETGGFCFFFVIPALLLTGAAMAGAGGAAGPPPAARPRRRVAWRPRISAVATVGGLLFGVGLVVLLQQYAVAPLTQGMAIAGIAGGLLLGLAVPSLVRVYSVMRVNGALARAERRLSEASANREETAQPPEEPPAEGAGE